MNGSCSHHDFHNCSDDLYSGCFLGLDGLLMTGLVVHDDAKQDLMEDLEEDSDGEESADVVDDSSVGMAASVLVICLSRTELVHHSFCNYFPSRPYSPLSGGSME